ncbi:hypothetical protein PQX77_011328 [Marasmius sp. AFHP31]|nr:hypothetical protein PQX77_011328 [Marasmius sp. AFHP31]
MLLRIGVILTAPIAATLGAFALPGIAPRTIRQASVSDMKALAHYTQFARAAYCSESKLRAWKCGEACADVPDFQPTLVAGDGGLIQTHFVGFWPEQSAVVVAHQGTDPMKIAPILTDINILLVPIDYILFPGAPKGTRVHDGFQLEHGKTAINIKQEVEKLMELYDIHKIYTIGHSLGGALAILDGLYLSLQFPDASVETIVYGAPRVGNAQFADFVSSELHDLTRVNNKKGKIYPIPALPPRWLGFKHPQGEMHFLKLGSAVHCDGEDNDIDDQCTARTVHEPVLATGNLLDHLGPYEGTHMGTIYCN